MTRLDSLSGRTVLMSGGSRGIGLAIAMRAAHEGANIALLGQTHKPHPKLPGTMHTAAEAIEDAGGGAALPFVGDVRDDATVAAFVDATVNRFGGIDSVVNNASALDLSGTEDIAMRSYDLMQDVNVRGTFLLTRTALPHLQRSDHAHVLTLSPPLDLDPHWAGSYLAYTIVRYGMSLCTLGWAEAFHDVPIAVNSLWPRTPIATAAVVNLLGGEDVVARSRTPQIVADAAHALLLKDPVACTGNFFIDDEVLVAEGVEDLDRYLVRGGATDLEPDLFLYG